MIPLSHILDHLHKQPQSTVATLDGKPRTARDLLHQIAQAATALLKRPEKTWGLHLADGYHFAAAFLALLHAQKTPVLLPSAQPDFLKKVGSNLDAVVLDSADLPTGSPTTDFAPLHPATARLALFTSGSTGEPKLVEKTLAHIEAELACLEATFPIEKDTVTLSTVSHQHIYGLLFSVLRPLTSCRVFEARCYHFPNELTARMAHCPKVELVSSPSHLGRLPELVDLTVHQNRVRSVFSSGAPLSREASLTVRRQLGTEVTEVYGSTETGGIAYRRQTEDPDSELWTPFSVVEASLNPQNSTLSVRSPYVDPHSHTETEDRVAFRPDGRFRLLGRADRVVKVEGKRLSLPELEARLLASAWVAQCRALVLQGSRSVVAVVLVLTKEGKHSLSQIGRPQFHARLKEELAAYFERVLLPRKWRIVEELPINHTGKTTQESLERLFKDTNPTVLSVRKSENQVELELFVPESTVYFDGHFPGRPILPGVAQVDWAARLGKSHLQLSGDFQKLEAVKFYDFIEPDAKVKLTLQYKPEKGKLYFSFEGNERRHSSGRIVFG